MTALTGEKPGLFARTGQPSLKAAEGAVEMQAQNGNLRLNAEKKPATCGCLPRKN